LGPSQLEEHKSGLHTISIVIQDEEIKVREILDKSLESVQNAGLNFRPES